MSPQTEGVVQMRLLMSPEMTIVEVMGAILAKEIEIKLQKERDGTIV